MRDGKLTVSEQQRIKAGFQDLIRERQGRCGAGGSAHSGMGTTAASCDASLSDFTELSDELLEMAFNKLLEDPSTGRRATLSAASTSAGAGVQVCLPMEIKESVDCDLTYGAESVHGPSDLSLMEDDDGDNI